MPMTARQKSSSRTLLKGARLSSAVAWSRHMVVEVVDDSSGVSDNVQRVSGLNETQPLAPSRVRGGVGMQ